MKHTVYLAGPIAGLTYEQSATWRNRAKELLAQQDIGVRYPTLNKNVKPTTVYNDQGYTEIPELTAQAIVATDRWCVRDCSFVLMNLIGSRKASIGSMVELGWADILGKPIISVLDTSDQENPHNHGFVKELSTVIVPDIETAVDVIVRLVHGLE